MFTSIKKKIPCTNVTLIKRNKNLLVILLQGDEMTYVLWVLNGCFKLEQLNTISLTYQTFLLATILIGMFGIANHKDRNYNLQKATTDKC